MAAQQDNSASAYPQQNSNPVPLTQQEGGSAYPQQTVSPSSYPQQESSAPLYTQKESGSAYTQQDQMYGGESVSAIPLLQLNDLCKRYPGMGRLSRGDVLSVCLDQTDAESPH